MNRTFQAKDWNQYRMEYGRPHEVLEPLSNELQVVKSALETLRDANILSGTDYPKDKMMAHRQAVAELFEIPWTAITPRMQRLIYAINAIRQPQRMIAAGVFCGNTFISNAGAAVGPGACYQAKDLLGVEIRPEEADRAEKNVRRLDPSGVARVIAENAVDTVKRYEQPIDLLYLDADGTDERGKGVYLDILEEAWNKMPEGSLVLAHNSVNCAAKLSSYLDFVRDDAHCSSSVNVILDIEGLEVSKK